MAKSRVRPPFKGLPFNRMIPNILTLLALSAGLTAVRYGIQGRWEYAVLAIMVAAVLDGLDGRVARILNGASRFGAELDSLSDFIAFGVAPALIHYLWIMREAGGIGWVLVCLYAVCCGLRLARFNTLMDASDRPTWAGNFFVGVPAPAAAGIVLLPIVVSFQEWAPDLRMPQVSGAFLILVSVLMVSHLSTYSFKRFKVPANWVLPTMLIAGMLAALLVTETWLTMAVVTVMYLCSIPFSVRSYRKLARRLAETHPVSTRTGASRGAGAGTDGDSPGHDGRVTPMRNSRKP